MDNGGILFIIVLVLTVYPTGRIMSRAGFNPAFSFLIIIPLIGPLIVLIILAYRDWPTLKTSNER